MPTLPAGPRGSKPRLTPPTNYAPPNYFCSAEVASRYSQVRPYFHAEAVERLRAFAGVQRFGRVLDVGCGSGQSAIALAAIAREVTAIDPSQAMLEQAPPHPNIRYRVGSAEQLDFSDGEFDLVSAGSALHWFDQGRFYAECRRVLAEPGLLAVYNDHFTTHMQESPGCRHKLCTKWMRSRFAKRFPPPRRGMRDIDEQMAAGWGFAVQHRGSFTHLVPFTRQQLIAYLLTRSNTLAVLGDGEQTLQPVMEWLDGELAPIVPDGTTGTFLFKCNLWLMRKADEQAG